MLDCTSNGKISLYNKYTYNTTRGKYKMKLKFLPILSSLTTMLIFSGCSAGSNDSTNTSQLNMTLKPVSGKLAQVSNLSNELESAICQGSNCSWANSANQNITQGETDSQFCTGTNSAYNGTGYSLGAGAYGMSLPTGIAAPKTGSSNTDVILELFNTKFESITPAMLQQYASMGYTSIWVSPPQYSATVMYNVNGNTPDNIPAWYGAYQPMDFGQIGNESNPLSYGNAEQLATLVTNAHKAGLQVIIDIAIHQFAAPGSISSIGNATNYYSGSVNNPTSFYWPQTSVNEYIPFANIWQGKSSCATTSGTVMQGANPNNSTSMWAPDFAGSDAGYGNLPAGSNSSSWVNPTTGGSGASCNTQSLFDGYAAWLMGVNYGSGSMTTASSSTTGFNVDGFRIDDISGQSSTFWNQLFIDTAAYNKSSNIFFGEYPDSNANDYNAYTAIKTASGNNISNNTMKMLNFPLLAGLNGAFAYGANLQASLTSMISSSNAYQSSSNGTLAGVNAINLVMDQDTVPDSFSSRAMCPWTGSNEFTMNYYNAPLAYGVILAMEAGTPYVFADLQAQANEGVNSSGAMTNGLGNGSVSYWNENEVIAGVYFHNQTLGKTMTWANINSTAGANVAALTRGNNYVFIVNKSTTDYELTDSSSSLASGCYIDLMSRQIVNVSNGAINQLYVPGQSVMYFVPYTGSVPNGVGFTCSAS